jgi:hypothetical protein
MAEYESRQERYDGELSEKYGVDITDKPMEEKIAKFASSVKNSMKNSRMLFISGGEG